VNLSEDDRDAIEAMLHSVELVRAKLAGYTDLSRSDEFTQWGVFYGLVRLGEASASVSESVRSAYPSLPWRKMKDLRNRIAHGYDLPSLPIVWNVIQHELPTLAIQLRQILGTLE
jgi:uncharacterized protein with HEPN domain